VPIVLFARAANIWWTEGLILSAGNLLGGYFGAKLSGQERARTWVFRILVAVIVLELVHLSIRFTQGSVKCSYRIHSQAVGKLCIRRRRHRPPIL
jgi:hypothetical protein